MSLNHVRTCHKLGRACHKLKLGKICKSGFNAHWNCHTCVMEYVRGLYMIGENILIIYGGEMFHFPHPLTSIFTIILDLTSLISIFFKYMRVF